jgi:N-acetylmuramoyl-L-alanine amidase
MSLLKVAGLELPDFGPELYRIVDRPVRNHSARSARPDGVTIDALVIHDTETLDVWSVLSTFDNPTEARSAHYVIDREGSTYRLVDPARKAWHAGVSALWGQQDVNEFSIGIELVGIAAPAPGTHLDAHTLDYTNAQLTTLCALTVDLMQRYPIPLNRIVGHADIALPRGRKTDPGPAFPWREYLEVVGMHAARRALLRST